MRRHGRGQLAKRLKCPPLPALLEILIADDARPAGRRRGRRINARIVRAGGDPMLEVLDNPIGQLSRRRHLQMPVGVAHRLQQPALVRLARHDRRTARPASGRPGFRVEYQAAAGNLRSARMADGAFRREDGPNLRLEELIRGRLRAHRCRDGNDQRHGESAG
jgi:hypothetical protein